MALPLGKNWRENEDKACWVHGPNAGRGIVTCWRLLASHSDGIDVTGVSREGLLAGAFPHVPQLGQRVAGSGDEGVHVGGQSQGHAVSNVVGEDHLLLACLQVPQAADGTRGKDCGQR